MNSLHSIGLQRKRVGYVDLFFRQDIYASWDFFTIYFIYNICKSRKFWFCRFFLFIILRALGCLLSLLNRFFTRDEQFQCKYWRTVTFLSSVSPLEHWLHWHRFHRHSVSVSARLNDTDTESRWNRCQCSQCSSERLSEFSVNGLLKLLIPKFFTGKNSPIYFLYTHDWSLRSLNISRLAWNLKIYVNKILITSIKERI